MKKTYECMLLLDNREVREGWQALKSHVEGLFAKHGCDIKSSRRWDERRLAYPIKHQHRATYHLIYMEADAAQMTGLRRDLQFDEKVLRDLMFWVESIPEEAYQPEEAFDETAIQVEDVAGPTPEEVQAEMADDADDDSGDSKAGDKPAGDGDKAAGDGDKAEEPVASASGSPDAGAGAEDSNSKEDNQ